MKPPSYKFVVMLSALSVFAFPSLGFKVGEAPGFAFSWSNENNVFLAGDIATIVIKVLLNGNSSVVASQFRPVVTVNGKAGNSSYLSGVAFIPDGTADNWRIVFVPIMTGLFNVIITEEQFKVLDSSLHFQVAPGPIYPPASFVSWMGLVHEFDAGAKAALLVLLKDAFGNNITSSNETLDSYNFTIPTLHRNGSLAVMQNISTVNWNKFGYIVVDFMSAMAGNFSLQVLVRGQNIDGSPLPYRVNPGPVDVSSCVARWKFETNVWQIFSRIEIFIHQMDRYGNLVTGLFEFDANVIENKTRLGLPVADFHFQEIAPGIQMLSFGAIESGAFLLDIYNAAQNESINNMPYAYTIYVGYCDGSKSVINGTGMDKSVAGEVQVFSVFLSDFVQYPFLVKAEMLRVSIIRQNDSYGILPNISPVQSLNGSTLAEMPTPVIAVSPSTIAPVPSADFSNESKGSSIDRASEFNVSYMPEKSGTYEIYVYCGNILLNSGRPIIKEVISGEANVSNSGVAKSESKVPKMIRNEVVVNLVDSFFNPVVSQQSRLRFDVMSANNSGFRTWSFMDNKDGSYSGFYLAMDIGTYEISVLFDDRFLPLCPFTVNVYSGEYFPKAYDDEVSVWEDESIAFEVLLNDNYAGDNVTVVNFSQPAHGSLLQYGQLFRYTPYKKFYGSDAFVYTITDVNGNLDDASVNIRVLKIPPQFVAFPVELEATEDLISPKFGGYSGFTMAYSDVRENISISLSAQFGMVSFSPLMMEFWPDGISIIRVHKEAKDLVIEGQVEPINSALQSLQYLGNENFSGGDTIRVSARNGNGRNDLDVPIYVEPINDAPIFRLPDSIILKYDGEEALIFDKQRDKFEFLADDPDLSHFPGGESQFLVSFSAEVSDGFLTTVLPAELINTTELKLETTYQWQPLHTYVAIAKHFKVKAIGVRFRGTIKDCNGVMQHLYYHGEGFGGVLTFEMNDLGNYGCYLDCSEKLSLPLYTRAKVNLIRRSPMSSLLAKSLGSALILELVMVSGLGLVLLFFTCKCAILLVKERIRRDAQNSEVSIQNQTVSKTIINR